MNSARRLFSQAFESAGMVMTRVRLQTWCGALLLGLLVANCVVPADAQQSAVAGAAGSSNVIVPPFVRFSGVLKDLNGNPLTGVVGVTFSLYTDSQSSVPVWTEVQNVYPDSTGHYSVILGIEKSTGLPTDIFISGEGRWLSVQAEGQPAQARVLLLSVPYALKAADAETLGGKPASAYVLNPQATGGAPASGPGNGAATSSSTRTNAVSASVSGGGTASYIPLWSSSSNLGNSIVYQSAAGLLGIGTTSPVATIDVREATGIRAIASGNGIAIYGDSTVATGTGKGLEGDSASTSGTGVSGYASATTGFTQGVWGGSYSTSGIGVLGRSHATTGNTLGVEGTIYSTSGVGVQGDGNGIGVQGLSSSSTGTAGVFNNTGGGEVLSAQINGTEVFSVGGNGVTQVGTSTANFTGMLNAASTLTSYAGIVATGSTGALDCVKYQGCNVINGSDGLFAFGGSSPPSGIGGAGVVAMGGEAAPSALGGNGVEGYGGIGSYGVVGYGGSNSSGVTGFGGFGVNSNGPPGLSGTGGFGYPQGGPGVFAEGSGEDGAPDADGDGIFATNPDGGTVATGGYAGYFEGDINVTGTIYAGTKDFRIDHPTDPANKYLLHASVESSEMMNIYTGNAMLDGRGVAVVQLPAWFEAVNGDFRYQLTSIGAPGPGLYIAQEISGNRFMIAGGSAGTKVSWQVTAVRHDAYAKAYPLIVEQEKSARERGYYVHPELYGAAKERGIARERYPEAMRQFKRKSPPQAPKLQPGKLQQAKASSK
jgi:hypothetical protein